MMVMNVLLAVLAMVFGPLCLSGKRLSVPDRHISNSSSSSSSSGPSSPSSVVGILQSESTSAAVTSMTLRDVDLPVRSADNNRTHDDDDDDSDHLFEVFKTVFIYAGVPFICALVVVWFICSQTTLLKRQRVSAVANDRETSMSRDQAPVSKSFSSDDCSSEWSVGSSSGSAESVGNYCIVALSPAYGRRNRRRQMDKHHLTRSYQPEPHTSGRTGLRRLEK